MVLELDIATPRMRLRPVCPADRSNLIALEADPEVMRFLNGGLPVPEAGLSDADFLTPRGREPEVLAAELRGSGTFIGWFAFFDDGLVDGLRTAEIGYRLARSAWGQGYATEGVQALVDVALHRLGCERVRAETMAINWASRRVLEKAGFLCVKTKHPQRHPERDRAGPDMDHGEVVYEVLKAG